MVPVPQHGLAPEQVASFRSLLARWYRDHARHLPWREGRDPYRTWVSEVMLQQTRVAAVLEHYARFLRLFPTIIALALAPEADVLAAWSGLGYYRRARMLHKAAQFLMKERGGHIPETAAELKTLPGIGDYTCAAIASIAFGESLPVIDGNVERVLLRVTGQPASPTAVTRTFVCAQATQLMPAKNIDDHINAAGDHNQAMMELGATVCLPRAPLCLQCPVFDLCRTRGEHPTQPRARQTSRPAAFLLATRKHRTATQVLLERRSDDLSLMPGMLELPPLPLDVVAAREPILRLRHAITNTNYYVEVYAQAGPRDRTLRKSIPAAPKDLAWHPVVRLGELPLTGLARKILQRVDLLSVSGLETPKPLYPRNSRSASSPRASHVLRTRMKE